MTDDLVARLRAVDHMSVEDCFLQSSLFAHAADRLEAAEARVRGLEAEVRTLKMALEDATRGITAATNEADIRADERAETIERCAKVADKIADEHAKWKGDAVSADAAEQVAAAIRQLAQEVKHEAE